MSAEFRPGGAARDRLLDRIRATMGQRRGEPLPVPDLCRDGACDLNIPLPLPRFLEAVEADLGSGGGVDFRFRCRQLLELFRRAMDGKGQYTLTPNVCGGCAHNSEGNCSVCCCAVMESEPACGGYTPR